MEAYAWESDASGRVRLPDVQVLALPNPHRTGTGGTEFGIEVDDDGCVTAVAASGVAETAGVEPGMRIRQIDGYPCITKARVEAILNDPQKMPGAEVRFTMEKPIEGVKSYGAHNVQRVKVKDPENWLVVFKGRKDSQVAFARQKSGRAANNDAAGAARVKYTKGNRCLEVGRKQSSSSLRCIGLL